MERRWYSVWDPEVPKTADPKKPLPMYLKDTATSMPDRIALDFYGSPTTYKDLDNAIDKFAAGLIELRMKKGDRVAVFMGNCPQFIISYFGILRAGGIVVALNPMFKHTELEYELNDSGAEVLVAWDILYPEVVKIKDRVKLKHTIVTSLRDFLPREPTLPLPSEAEQPKQIFPGTIDFLKFLDRSSMTLSDHMINFNEDLALLQYTGGTTGLPKGAMLTHFSLAYSVLAEVLWFKYTQNDVHLGVTPFFHIMGMLHMAAQMISGGQIVTLARFTPEAAAKAISRYKCTTFMPAPTALIALLGWPDLEAYDFSSLRCLVSGAAPISVETQTKMKRLLPNTVIGEGYGLTETMAQGGLLTPLHRHKPGFVGIPQTGVDMKIVDFETESRELGPNEEGEIVIKGPMMMKGYWNRPKETSEVLREGWLYTGDAGVMDEEGYVRVVGRKKELIKCSGFSVFPSEVEGWLYQHPAIAEVAVIGVPDSYRGEAPKAFIVLKAEYKGKINEEEIIEWSKENMAAYKRPQMVEFRDELPKSAAGKVLKRLLG
jgi:acyl-CoA synthetase (AMP-forming)/AMP-acid ligase II